MHFHAISTVAYTELAPFSKLPFVSHYIYTENHRPCNNDKVMKLQSSKYVFLCEKVPIHKSGHLNLKYSKLMCDHN